MSFGNADIQVLGDVALKEQSLVIDRFPENRQIIYAFFQPVYELFSVHELGGNRHISEVILKNRHKLRHRLRRARADMDRTQTAVKFNNTAYHFPVLIHLRLSERCRELSRFIQGNFLILSHKELYAQLVLKLFHRAAQRGLADEQFFGGFRECAAFCERG